MELQALDHRAATYEKLGDFDKALKDGKSMIQLMPESSKASTAHNEHHKRPYLTIVGLLAMWQSVAAQE